MEEFPVSIYSVHQWWFMKWDVQTNWGTSAMSLLTVIAKLVLDTAICTLWYEIALHTALLQIMVWN